MQHRPPQQPYTGAPPSTQSEQPYQNYHPRSGLQSPFLSSQPQFQPHTSENPYYASPRSQHSTAGTYYPADKPESMAAAATMQQQRPYPPIYNTPQSNSPASVTSPQSHEHGRPLYAQPNPQLGQPIYGYPQYQSMNQIHQPTYQQHPPQQQHQGQPMIPYQSNTPQLPQGQVSHHSISSSPRLKSEPQQYQHQQSRPMMQPQHSTPAQSHASLPPQSQTPNTNSSAAPGPIPATTPLVVRQDGNGVQWIAFEYSRDRVKMEYTIRCDVESVDTNKLGAEFKSENCVYPRACVPREQYKGNRLAYETDCNQVGWALAELNPCLRGKRGLIQRAVDSWRNSNQDPRLRSRRVRRQAKITNRQKLSTSTPNQTPVQTSSSTGHPGSNSMPAPSSRPSGSMPAGSQQMHHHAADVTPSGQDNIGAPYSTAPQPYRQSSQHMNQAPQHMGNQNIRQAHVFPEYQAYPNAPTTIGPSMTPNMQGGMHQLGRQGGTAQMARDMDEKDDEESALFGDVPEGKRRKFILVEDTQKNARVRVKVTLDQIEMSEIPDSYRKQNSVFPRAYFPVQMQTVPETSRNDRFAGEEGEEVDAGPTLGRISVPVHITDGESEIDVPRISRNKRGREQKINELGYRMAWGQGRVFSGRPIFLARALDAYRGKQRTALMAVGQEGSAIPAHLEIRPGKRRWLERTRAINQPNTPPTTVNK